MGPPHRFKRAAVLAGPQLDPPAVVCPWRAGSTEFDTSIEGESAWPMLPYEIPQVYLCAHHYRLEYLEVVYGKLCVRPSH